MKEEAVKNDDSQMQKAIWNHALYSQAEHRIRAMIQLSRSDPRVSVTADELDTDGYLLNVENGTIDSRTGELLKHDRSHLITKLAPVKYDAEAPCPRFLRFLGKFSTATRL